MAATHSNQWLCMLIWIIDICKAYFTSTPFNRYDLPSGIGGSFNGDHHHNTSSWYFNPSSQDGFDLHLNVENDNLKFHPYTSSTFEIFLSGHTPHSTILSGDGAFLILFTVGNTQYFSFRVGLSDGVSWNIYPQSYSSLAFNDDVDANIVCLTTNRSQRLSNNEWSDINSMHSQALQWPLQLSITNNPITNTVYIRRYSSQLRDIVVEAVYNSSFNTDEDITIYILNERSDNRSFSIDSIIFSQYYIDPPTDHPSVGPTMPPTKDTIATRLPTGNPTEPPSESPTMARHILSTFYPTLRPPISLQPSSSPSKQSISTDVAHNMDNNQTLYPTAQEEAEVIDTPSTTQNSMNAAEIEIDDETLWDIMEKSGWILISFVGMVCSLCSILCGILWGYCIKARYDNKRLERELWKQRHAQKEEIPLTVMIEEYEPGVVVQLEICEDGGEASSPATSIDTEASNCSTPASVIHGQVEITNQ